VEPGGQGREGGVVAPEGIPFLLGAAAVAAVLTLVWPRTVPAALFGVLLTVFMGWFFRNPDRTSPSLPGAVISPADGKIVYAGDNPPGRYFGEPGKRVSVFMSILDVHVNRAPVSGRVAAVRVGRRVGLIRFGSRVDILLPASASLNVRVGDRVRAGESVVGVLS